MNKGLITLFLLLLVWQPLAMAEDEVAAKAIYYQLPDPFTLNFSTQSQQKVHYLQIKVALKSHDQAVIDSAMANLPMLQDAFQTLFSQQTYESVSTLNGRKALQTQAQKILQQMIKDETGLEGVDGIYFTSFILQ